MSFQEEGLAHASSTSQSPSIAHRDGASKRHADVKPSHLRVEDEEFDDSNLGTAYNPILEAVAAGDRSFVGKKHKQAAIAVTHEEDGYLAVHTDENTV